MAQFWVNDTPGGARTLSVPVSQGSWRQGGDGGDPSCTALAPLQVSGTPTPILGGRSRERRLGQGWAPPLLPGVTPPQLEGAPAAPPQHQAGSRGGVESSLRLRLPQFNLLPNVCHHRQNCNQGPGGCAGAGWPGDAVSLGRPGDLPPPQPGVPRCQHRGKGTPKHGPARQLRGEKVRREIQDSLCVWTRPRETGAPRGK